MRPHEETWEVDEQAVKDGDYTATDSDGFAVLTTYAREEGGSDELAEARLRLATVAPKMARAIKEALRNNGHLLGCAYVAYVGGAVECSDPLCAQFRAALAEAGVVP